MGFSALVAAARSSASLKMALIISRRRLKRAPYVPQVDTRSDENTPDGDTVTIADAKGRRYLSFQPENGSCRPEKVRHTAFVTAATPAPASAITRRI